MGKMHAAEGKPMMIAGAALEMVETPITGSLLEKDVKGPVFLGAVPCSAGLNIEPPLLGMPLLDARLSKAQLLHS